MRSRANTRPVPTAKFQLLQASALERARTDTTVVWTLRSWETALGPAVRSAVVVEKGVFLFNAEPWLFALDLLHKLVAVVSNHSMSYHL